jgi:hypothetical protein
VVTKKQEEQGPTCVTCHGSINGTVLNVTTVEEACSRCHNEESDNHPDTPGEARTLLNRFLSIHRYYRYITVRGDPVETKRFFEKIDRELHTLSMTWHTFDLDEIEKQTEAVLASLKEKREEVARVFKEERLRTRLSCYMLLGHHGGSPAGAIRPSSGPGGVVSPRCPAGPEPWPRG